MNHMTGFDRRFPCAREHLTRPTPRQGTDSRRNLLQTTGEATRSDLSRVLISHSVHTR
jgi:hypothetical protein